MPTLFVYGTLQHPPLVRQLLGRVVPMRSAELPDHRAAPMVGRAYPGLVVERGAVAAGRLLAVTDDEVLVLDDFEGPMYDRVPVRPLVDGRPESAETYRFRGEHALVGEGDWDLHRFVAEDAHRWVTGSQPGTHHPTD